MAVKQIYPVGAVVVLHGLCALLFGLYVAIAALDGLVQLAAFGVAGAALLLWITAARVTLFRSSADDGPVDIDLRASGLVVTCPPGRLGADAAQRGAVGGRPAD